MHLISFCMQNAPYVLYEAPFLLQWENYPPHA